MMTGPPSSLPSPDVIFPIRDGNTFPTATGADREYVPLTSKLMQLHPRNLPSVARLADAGKKKEKKLVASSLAFPSVSRYPGPMSRILVVPFCSSSFLPFLPHATFPELPDLQQLPSALCSSIRAEVHLATALLHCDLWSLCQLFNDVPSFPRASPLSSPLVHKALFWYKAVPIVTDLFSPQPDFSDCPSLPALNLPSPTTLSTVKQHRSLQYHHQHLSNYRQSPILHSVNSAPVLSCGTRDTVSARRSTLLPLH